MASLCKRVGPLQTEHAPILDRPTMDENAPMFALFLLEAQNSLEKYVNVKWNVNQRVVPDKMC